MRITLNGEPRDIDERMTVAALLDSVRSDRSSTSAAACAVEVNRALVPRRTHADRTLAEGDIVEIVTLVGGG